MGNLKRQFYPPHFIIIIIYAKSHKLYLLTFNPFFLGTKIANRHGIAVRYLQNFVRLLQIGNEFGRGNACNLVEILPPGSTGTVAYIMEQVFNVCVGILL